MTQKNTQLNKLNKRKQLNTINKS